MIELPSDIERLEQALRTFFQTIKRPQRWAEITAKAGIALDRPSATLLFVLSHHDPHSMRVQALAVHLGIEPPSVTRKTQELEAAGYIERIPDPDDKRATGICLTPLGREAAGRLRQVQRESMEAALRHWTKADRDQLVSLLEHLSQDIADNPPNPERKS